MSPIQKATPDHEAFYQDAMAALRSAIDRHPHIRALEVIAILARATGYAVATAYPDERDLARKTAIENMDQATRDVAQDAPPRKGIQQ